MNYKGVDLSKTCQLTTSFFIEGMCRFEGPGIEWEKILYLTHQIYDPSNHFFNIQDKDFLINFLNDIIFCFHNGVHLETDPLFFHFFIFLLKTFARASNGLNECSDMLTMLAINDDEREMIIDKILFVTSLLVSSENGLNYIESINEELILSVFPYLQTHKISIFTCINAINNKKVNPRLFLEIENMNFIETIIQIIRNNNFIPGHVIFIGLCLKHFHKRIHKDTNLKELFKVEKLLELGFLLFREDHGLFLITCLLKYFNFTSSADFIPKMYTIIEYHMILNKDIRNAKYVLRILGQLTITDSDFFLNFNKAYSHAHTNIDIKYADFVFLSFYEYFEIINDKDKKKFLAVVYLLIPSCSIELLPFFERIIMISSSCSFELITKICEDLEFFLQEVNKDIAEKFICLETFEVFERLLTGGDQFVFIKVKEILQILNATNHKKFVYVLCESSLFEILKSYTYSENINLQNESELILREIFEEEEEDFEDF